MAYLVPPLPLTGEITPNTFISVPDPSSSSSSSSAPRIGREKISTSTRIIFFIPGNPGLISYYHLFLALLAKGLAAAGSREEDEKEKKDIASSEPAPFVIYGRSLGGFEVEEDKSYSGSRLNSSRRKEKQEDAQKGNAGLERETPSCLYDLTEQIEFVERQLRNCVRRWRQSILQGDDYSSSESKLAWAEPKAQVILIGHSVGSYIAMEVLRRSRERGEKSSGATNAHDDGDEMEIIGGVMLFPTVVDIAKSPSGRKLTFLLSAIPYLPILVSLFAKALVWLLPNVLLYHLVRIFMGNPRKDIINTTMAFLSSKLGVRQSVYMGKGEMRDISADKWSNDVWGISRPELPSGDSRSSPARLIFYFGRNDHWVAEQTREDIIKARGAEEDSGERRPKMVVCEDGVSHGFCIGHNDVMAQKVTGFIHDIVTEQGE